VLGHSIAVRWSGECWRSAPSRQAARHGEEISLVETGNSEILDAKSYLRAGKAYTSSPQKNNFFAWK